MKDIEKMEHGGKKEKRPVISRKKSREEGERKRERGKTGRGTMRQPFDTLIISQGPKKKRPVKVGIVDE